MVSVALYFCAHITFSGFYYFEQTLTFSTLGDGLSTYWPDLYVKFATINKLLVISVMPLLNSIKRFWSYVLFGEFDSWCDGGADGA